MSTMEIFKAMLFGVVEGITEWLPVSSTGHMILLNQILPLQVSESFYALFEVVIQLGAIMAVLMVFWNRIWPFGQRNNKYPAAEEGLLSWVRMDRIPARMEADRTISQLTSCITAAVPIVAIAVWHTVFTALIPAHFAHSLLNSAMIFTSFLE